MLTPSTFGQVCADDYTVSPYTVYKDYTLYKQDALSRGYSIKTGYFSSKALPLGLKTMSVTQAPTSSDGSYNFLNWRSVYQSYYRNGYSAGESLEGYNSNKTYKLLSATASIISSPYLDIGEGFKPGSVHITGSTVLLRDDRNGNLYDTAIDTSNFIDSTYLTAYWGFEQLLPYTAYGTGMVSNRAFEYTSLTHGENLDSYVNNVYISPGVPVDSITTGIQAEFKTSNSYVYTRHSKELNYETEEDFCISFWIKCPPSQSNVDTDRNTILGKRAYADFTVYKTVTDSNQEGAATSRSIPVTEVLERPIDIYPYHFEIYNQTADISKKGKLQFTRSDGAKVITLISSASINDGAYHHISTVKSGSMLYLYTDGVLTSSGSDVPDQPTNDYHLIFGAENFTGLRQFSGSLDEIRFYNVAANAVQVSRSLAENTNGLLYQTEKVGNVFYKRGEVIITSLLPKYHEFIDDVEWRLKFKNIYTIYEFETLVRIKAGTYNRTMNPSSLQSLKSPIYREEFLTGSLTPYVTTVGLYNEKLQLVAVGKLGRPLKIREDVDVNVIVRWDY